MPRTWIRSSKEIIADGRVDVLVNCAAIAVDLNMKPFYEIDREDWQRVMDANATGTFECMRQWPLT